MLSVQTVFCLVFRLGNMFKVSCYRFGPDLSSANLRQFTLAAVELLQIDLNIIKSRGALLAIFFSTPPKKKCCL